jgi:hypothetical protein
MQISRRLLGGPPRWPVARIKPHFERVLRGSTEERRLSAHIGVDADLGLVHSVRDTSDNVSDVTECNHVSGQITMRPGKRKALNKENRADVLVGAFGHRPLKTRQAP